MKKLINIAILTVLLMTSMSLAETDLSGLTFQELSDLRDRCQAEMMKTDEWQEVTVPPGVYQVGKHIPAGTWRVICRVRNSSLIMWGDRLDENGHEVTYEGTDRYDIERVFNPDGKYFEKGSVTEYTFTVKDGEWIIIDDTDMVFTPPVTPSFSFK